VVTIKRNYKKLYVIKVVLISAVTVMTTVNFLEHQNALKYLITVVTHVNDYICSDSNNMLCSTKQKDEVDFRSAEVKL